MRYSKGLQTFDKKNTYIYNTRRRVIDYRGVQVVYRGPPTKTRVGVS